MKEQNMDSDTHYLDFLTFDDNGSGNIRVILQQPHLEVPTLTYIDEQHHETFQCSNIWFGGERPLSSEESNWRYFGTSVLAQLGDNSQQYIYISNSLANFTIHEPVLEFQSKYSAEYDKVVSYVKTANFYYFLDTYILIDDPNDIQYKTFKVPASSIPAGTQHDLIVELIETLHTTGQRFVGSTDIVIPAELASGQTAYNPPPLPLYDQSLLQFAMLNTNEGSRFKVQLNGTIYNHSENSLFTHIHLIPYDEGGIGYHFRAQTVFIGSGSYDNTEVNMKDWLFFGNSLLCELVKPSRQRPGLYVYIGDRIEFFIAERPIKKFIATVGNSGIVYAYAEDEDSVYFFQDNDEGVKKVTKGHFENYTGMGVGDVYASFYDLSDTEKVVVPSVVHSYDRPFAAQVNVGTHIFQIGSVEELYAEDEDIAPAQLLPSQMTSREIASLPTHTVKSTEEMNGLILEEMNAGDVVVFIKDTGGKIFDDQAIVVYKSNGIKTNAVDSIFNIRNPKNPFTRRLMRPEDIVLKRVAVSVSSTPAMVQPSGACKNGKCAIMGGYRVFERKAYTLKKSIRYRRGRRRRTVKRRKMSSYRTRRRKATRKAVTKRTR
jgi:hypothetical protein